MTDDARVAETHSAWVFMVGDRAYKLKKPVDLGFLDFSTRSARERALHREVELNRRLAPDVYLGVADVIDPDGDLCDHLAVMRRMPDDRRLSILVGEAAPLHDEIRAIARVIATFHAAAATSPEITEVGGSVSLRRKLDQDIAELRAFVGTVLDASALDAVAELGHRFLDGREPLFRARQAAGQIRDGHGDLLADDIFCLPDGPRILDCIEFDDRLRYGDVLADVAFLVMDLERLGAPNLGADLVVSYQEFSAEKHPMSLIDYYVACRALIRSKVACIRATQGSATAGADATRLLELAIDHLRRGRVLLILVGGLPGTGKSTLATDIADRLGCTVLSSDSVRKDLAGVAHTEHAEAPFETGIYDVATTEATYRELIARARLALELGESVVLDASWSHAPWRSAAAQLGDDTMSDVVELYCEVAPEVGAARIVARQAIGEDLSDATPAIATAMSIRFDSWPMAHVISTSRSPDRVLASALDLIDAS